MTDTADRSRRGRDVLSTLGGSPEAGAAMAGFLEGQGALGQFALRTGAGEVWSRPGLSRRDRSLVVITFLNALRQDLELRAHIAGGLNHGLTREEVDEIFVQMGAYAGLPCGLTGARIAGEVFAGQDGETSRAAPAASAEEKSDTARRVDGLAALTGLLGLPPGTDMKAAEQATLDQLGDMGALVLDFAFGEVWSRPQLSRRDRSLVVVATLAALSLSHELEIHLRGALAHGVTPAEIEEVMITLVIYGGFPRAIDGLQLARKVLQEGDSR